VKIKNLWNHQVVKWCQVTKNIFLPFAQFVAQGRIIDLTNLNLGIDRYQGRETPLGKFQVFLVQRVQVDSATKKPHFRCLDTPTKDEQVHMIWMIWLLRLHIAIISKHDQFLNVVFVSKTLALTKPWFCRDGLWVVTFHHLLLIKATAWMVEEETTTRTPEASKSACLAEIHSARNSMIIPYNWPVIITPC